MIERLRFVCADCGRRTEAFDRAPKGWVYEAGVDGAAERLRCDACWRRYLTAQRQTRRARPSACTVCEVCDHVTQGLVTVCESCGMVQGGKLREDALRRLRAAVRDGLNAGLSLEELSVALEAEVVELENKRRGRR